VAAALHAALADAKVQKTLEDGGAIVGGIMKALRYRRMPRGCGAIMSTTAVAVHVDNIHDQPVGWRRYVYSTNHKDIGTMYLVFAIMAGVIGGAFSILMRRNAAQPQVAVIQCTRRSKVEKRTTTRPDRPDSRRTMPRVK
jgi:hypothetical protein